MEVAKINSQFLCKKNFFHFIYRTDCFRSEFTDLTYLSTLTKETCLARDKILYSKTLLCQRTQQFHLNKVMQVIRDRNKKNTNCPKFLNNQWTTEGLNINKRL